MGGPPERWIEHNRAAWNLRTSVHVDSPFYGVDRVRAGASTLHRIERELVGEVDGRRLLHLQCHFGLDTISWARQGAQATGVDFSDVAIAYAEQLARELAVDVEFEHADVQRLDFEEGRRFDVAVATYGIIPWIGDLRGWAAGIYGALADGGRFVLVDFHPILEVFYPGKVSGLDRYFAKNDPPLVETTGTYARASAAIRYSECRWQHTVADIIGALLGAGFRLTWLGEHPETPIPLIPDLVQREDGLWENNGRVPLLLSLVVRRD